jgi:hypothetical protein
MVIPNIRHMRPHFKRILGYYDILLNRTEIEGETGFISPSEKINYIYHSIMQINPPLPSLTMRWRVSWSFIWVSSGIFLILFERPSLAMS